VLLDLQFWDGAVFHTYHAYECVLSAMIAASGYPVPPEGITQITLPNGKQAKLYPSPAGHIPEPSAHKARVLFFDQLADQTKPYWAAHSNLKRFLSVSDRMASLYYESRFDWLPQDAYNESYARPVYQTVHQFAVEVWEEIR
jgi:hypothetical protein